VRAIAPHPGGGDHPTAMPPFDHVPFNGAEQGLPPAASRTIDNEMAARCEGLTKLDRWWIFGERATVAKGLLITSKAGSPPRSAPPAARCSALISTRWWMGGTGLQDVRNLV